MTREEMINIFKCAVNGAKDERYISFLPTSLIEAITHAIKELEQEPCEDCISRQAVFEQINCWIGNGEYRYTNATYYLTRRIKELSSINPIETKIDVLDKINGEIKEYCEKNCIDGDIVANELSLIIDKYRQEG